MDGIEVKLLMSFMTSSGRKVSLFVTDPREDVTETIILFPSNEKILESDKNASKIRRSSIFDSRLLRTFDHKWIDSDTVSIIK